MFWSARRNRLGPTLAALLAAPVVASGPREPLQVLVICTARGLRVLRRHHDPLHASEALPYALVRLRPDEVVRLSRERHIVLMELDEPYGSLPRPHAVPGLRNADVFEHYKRGPLRDLDGDGVRIMVQDSGLSPHPDLPPDRITAIDFTGEGDSRDVHGHGTAIVSQIAGIGAYPGLVPAARVLMARIFDRAMQTSLSRILWASATALERNVHIINMSYGAPAPHPIIELAMNRLHAAGICLVAAAGNEGPGLGTVAYPGAYGSLIAIAATDKQGHLADFSSRGRPGAQPTKPDLAAEGVNIVMARSPDAPPMGTPVTADYIAASGTSFAAPIATCLAAMVLQARGGRTTPDEVRGILQAAAIR